MRISRRLIGWRNARHVRRRSPDYARVAPWLLVGPVLDARGYAHLADEGVTHVLDLRSEASDDPELMRSLGLAWRRIPIDDRMAPTDLQLTEINRWLDGSDEDEPVVYLHCQGGLGRSPTVAIALLMQRGFSRAEAHRFILAGRPVASPTPNQDEWLAAIESELHQRLG